MTGHAGGADGGGESETGPQTGPIRGSITVRPFAAIADRPRLKPEIEAIFFAASATRSFAGDAVRTAFRERWLGRFLDHFPDCAFLALDDDGAVAGYIVGALADPAKDPRFSDIGYFRDFGHLTARYPAHLHINLAANARNRGIGGRLIDAFCGHARTQGAPGVHAVTAEQSRNRSFYARNGFALQATVDRSGPAIVFLARAL